MCKRAGRKDNELKDGLHSIRAACLRSFPEFLADIRMAALGKTGELSTGLADFTNSVSFHFLNIPLDFRLTYPAISDSTICGTFA